VRGEVLKEIRLRFVNSKAVTSDPSPTTTDKGPRTRGDPIPITPILPNRYAIPPAVIAARVVGDAASSTKWETSESTWVWREFIPPPGETKEVRFKIEETRSGDVIKNQE
jgi:hypothetical protein